MQHIQNKYKPKTITDFVGNIKQIQSICSWLRNYDIATETLKKYSLLRKPTKGRKKKVTGLSLKEENICSKQGNLVVTGSHGCGKTTIVNLILKDLNYEVININTLDNKIELNNNLLSKLSVINQQRKFTEDGKPLVLLIDEFESIITTFEKSSILNIIKENNYYRWIPIIIIGNNQHNKQLNDIKKFADEVKIYPPYQNELLKWVYLICKQEHINIDYNAIPKFIENCQNDIRRILIHLDELLINYGNNKKISIFQLDNFDNTMKTKDQDFDLFKCTEKLLTDYKDIETCIYFYEMDKVLVPLMIHEHYHRYLPQNRYKIIDNFSKSDIIENYIYGEQNWDLIEIHSILCSAYPSYYINKYGSRQKGNKLFFPEDLHRTSVKMMNKKNITKTNDINKKLNIITRNKTMSEFIYMNDLKD